jgi:hypothetical protein
MSGVFIYTRRTKEGDKKSGIICLIFGFIVLALTFLLPSNILDIPVFKNFVNIMAGVFPTIADFAKYSEFPHVSQFVFALEIIFIPVLTIIMFHFYDVVLDFDKALEKPIVYILAGPLLLFGGLISPFFLLPGKPNPAGMIGAVVAQSYHVRLIFSICTTILCISCSWFILMIVGYIRGLARYFLE